MTWTAPEVTRPGGSLTAPESDLLRGMLDYERSTLLWKCAGLTGEQLTLAPLERTNLTLLGLIRHLSKVERVWFREQFRGEAIDRLYSTPERRDADYEDVVAADAEADYNRLVAEQETARKTVEGEPLDSTFTDRDGDEMSLRAIFVHMIREYARHNGHADLIRQYVDGTTGA